MSPQLSPQFIDGRVPALEPGLALLHLPASTAEHVAVPSRRSQLFWRLAKLRPEQFQGLEFFVVRHLSEGQLNGHGSPKQTTTKT